MNAALMELQQRVRAAELRVTARDAALRQRVEWARTGWQRQTRRARWLPLAAGVAIAVGALWWLFRPRHGAVAAPLPSAAPSRSRAPWMRAIALLWPLLPVRWRTGAHPAGAVAFASLGLPLLEAWLSDRRPAPTTAPYVDLQRYMGTWYEIARLPTRFERRCARQPSARYTLHGDRVQVSNRCRGDDGRVQLAVGEARVVAGSGNARLKVSFVPALLRALPFAWGDYWILHVDPDYRFAVVGDPGRRHCWLLARGPQPAPAERERLVRIAADRGFAVQRLIHQRAAA